jgi:hypothetical protein
MQVSIFIFVFKAISLRRKWEYNVKAEMDKYVVIVKWFRTWSNHGVLIVIGVIL